MLRNEAMRRIPWSIVACVVALMGLGLSGIARGDELAHAGEFFSKQVVWIVLALVAVLLAMLFAAGARLRHLVCIGCLGAAVSPVFWLAISAEQKSRITALFLQRDGGPTPTGDGYHLHQSKQVLALGGIAGSQFSGMA